VSRQPTVEDVSDSKSDESEDNFTPDSVTSSDLSGHDSEFDMKEIQSDAKFLAFATGLQRAHDQMVSDKRAEWATKKRKVMYLGIQTDQNGDGEQKVKRQKQLASPP